MVAKVTLNLPSELMEKIKAEAKERNLTVTEIFRRGLETELYLTREEKIGSRLIIKRSTGEPVEIFRP